MRTPAITVEVLPAGYGDSLLVSCPVDGRTWRMLVDTGPDECWPMLRERLARIAPDARGQRLIDLAVITHIDHDHIGAAAALFGDRDLRLRFGDVWFNAPPRPRRRGVAEGDALAALLGAPGVALPWNAAFGGDAAVTPDTGATRVVALGADAPRLTLLSPSRPALANLFKVWARELQRLREPARAARPAAATRGGTPGLDLDALAARASAPDRARANGSSIAFLLEHRGASLLLGADAIPGVLVPALATLARDRGPLPLVLDALKLSHHGSRGNLTRELLQAVRARHYLVSTNGAIFGHPDDEAMARAIVHGGPGATLWFNFDSVRNRRWAEPELRRRHGHAVVLPPEGAAGVLLALDGR